MEVAFLSSYDLVYLSQKAEEIGFVRDTLEKVYRLADILKFLNTVSLLRDSLALKGGTAINLTIFNLPRLSVDIDLDYVVTNSKEDMLENREKINAIIQRFMASSGYERSPKTKVPHSLDSWVYSYINAAGNRDNIKIEINYSLRAHILPLEQRPIVTEHFYSDYLVNTLAAVEIFGSKIAALLNRTAARDLYDVANMIRYGIFDESEEELLRKCVLFYTALSAVSFHNGLDMGVFDQLTEHRIKTDLLPVLRKKESFDLESAKKRVRTYINDLMKLTESEVEFLERFKNKDYRPELLFDDEETVARLAKHPMALWKTRTA
jgi:predicted nucleotidyltransferase component of viral defense system